SCGRDPVSVGEFDLQNPAKGVQHPGVGRADARACTAPSGQGGQACMGRRVTITRDRAGINVEPLGHSSPMQCITAAAKDQAPRLVMISLVCGEGLPRPSRLSNLPQRFKRKTDSCHATNATPSFRVLIALMFSSRPLSRMSIARS